MGGNEAERQDDNNHMSKKKSFDENIEKDKSIHFESENKENMTKDITKESDLLDNDADIFLVQREELEDEEQEREKNTNTAFGKNEEQSGQMQKMNIDSKDVVDKIRDRAESDISKPSSETGLILAGGHEDGEEILP